MCHYDHTQHAGSNMSHGPPTFNRFQQSSDGLASASKLTDKTVAAPVAFWDALLETSTCGRLVAPVVGAIA